MRRGGGGPKAIHVRLTKRWRFPAEICALLSAGNEGMGSGQKMHSLVLQLYLVVCWCERLFTWRWGLVMSKFHVAYMRTWMDGGACPWYACCSQPVSTGGEQAHVKQQP